ncbi:protein of unknown function [Methylocaldum szegediense]|uniref:Uncharacterized protein n=1 Tax=Methylocaldum szegediense TaxID=73780 RepID=A0ABM9I7R4_9GAMM|nr:protein of unknown function [Methylocaldum szegediense]
MGHSLIAGRFLLDVALDRDLGPNPLN